MQERYLGDVHDFYKFNFLEYLSIMINEKIGLNWYLNNPQNIGKNEVKLNDGEIRSFLVKENYRSQNLKLINDIKHLELKKNRSIQNYLQKSYLNKHIDFYNRKLTIDNRVKWFKSSLTFFKNNNFLFLDPDNGLQNQKANFRSKRSVKYIKYSEIENLYESKKVIIFCQFQSFTMNHREMLELKINSIKKYLGLKGKVPVIRNRSGPNTFYPIIGSTKNIRQLEPLLENYIKKNPLTQLLEF